MTTTNLELPESARAHIRLGLAFLDFLALPDQPLTTEQRAMVEALSETIYWQGRADALLADITVPKPSKVESPVVTDVELGM